MRDKDVLKKLSSVQLPRTHFKITEELKSRRVIRTRNNPVSDYAEWPAHRKTGFSLTGNSTQDLDAIDKNGKKYQIKTRELIPLPSSRLPGVIRDLGKKQFDVLIVVMFNRDFNIDRTYAIARGITERYSKIQLTPERAYSHFT